MMRRLASSKLAAANVSYSRAVAGNGLLLISGQIGRDIDTTSVPESVEAQLEICFKRLDALCRQAGAHIDQAMKATVYLVGLREHRAAVDDAFGRWFGGNLPARTMVGVNELPGGAAVEVDLMVGL